MNRRFSDKRDILLADTFALGVTQSLPSQASRAARTARIRQIAGSVAALTSVLAVVVVGGLQTMKLRRPSRVIASSSTPNSGHIAASSHHYETISDAEMLTLASQRPVLIVTDANGRRRVVFLDQLRNGR